MRVLAVVFCLAAISRAQVITTVAGTDWSFPAARLPGVRVPLADTNGVAIDANGNIYFIDGLNNLVLRQSPDGGLTVIAGNGIGGYSGDGGPATSASMNLEGGLCLDAAGNVYVADTFNDRVRKISTNGIITTVAGNGAGDFSGDGGPATLASLYHPESVVVDSSGNLFIADEYNHRIRKVSGNIITTFAGSGAAGTFATDAQADAALLKEEGGAAINATLAGPVSLALDGKGGLYVSDETLGRVRLIRPDGTIVTVAGSHNKGGQLAMIGEGLATKTLLGEPNGVAVDVAGNLYIADTLSEVIRKVTPDGIIRTIAGIGRLGFDGDGGRAMAARVFHPKGLGVDKAGNIFIADSANGRIRKVTLDGVISTIAGNGAYKFSGDGGLATSAVFNYPRDLAIDGRGNLFVADTESNRIRKIDAAGLVSTIAGTGGTGYFGDGPALATSIDYPAGMAIDGSGNLFLGAQDNCMVREVTAAGAVVTLAGVGPSPDGRGICPTIPYTGDGGSAVTATLQPEAIAVDGAGTIYAADIASDVVRKFKPGGAISTFAGIGKLGYSGDGGPANAAMLAWPSGVAADASGNLFISEYARLRKVSASGVITTIAGNGNSGYSGDGGPAINAQIGGVAGSRAGGVTADNKGNLYLADTANNRIRKIDPAGIITTIAGNGQAGYSGDGGPATNASLNHPTAVRLDAAGNIYIVDWDNSRIRVILAQPPAATVSPSRLEFTASSAGAIPPAQGVIFSGAVPGLAYTTQIDAGAAWLKISPAAGVSPSLVQVTADPANLAPGTYTATITFSSPVAGLSARTTTVRFTVSAPQPPSLAVDNASLSFPYPSSGTARSQELRVSNSGGGGLFFIAKAATRDGSAWLSVSPGGGQATPSTPVSLTVTADPAGLSPGTYTGTILIDSASGSATTAVTMTISSNPSAMLLSQSGLSFLAIEQGGIGPPQSFGVLNLGTGALPISVDVSTPAGVSWLTAGPAPASGGTQTVDVLGSPAGLTAGRYYGLVSVQSPGAANSPQVVTSVIEVLPKGTDLGAVLQPNELAFRAPSGGSPPGSQTVVVYNLTATPKTFRASGIDPWLVVVPRDATVSPGSPVTIVVQPLTDKLAAGNYRSSIGLQFDDGRLRTFGVNLAVGSGASAASAKLPAEAGGCTPTKLLPALKSLGNDFTVAAGWPVALQAEVQDDCGTPFESGSVVAEFSNGDRPVSFTSLKGGRWDGTWKTNRQQAGVTITIKAVSPDSRILGVNQVSGGLSLSALPPVTSEDRITDAASGVAFRSLSPGDLITISGDRLSDQSAKAPAVPYGVNLANTSIRIAGRPAPIASTDPSQIVAIVPYGIEVNTRHQILIQRGAALSDPVPVNVSASSPAVFSAKSGTQGMIFDAAGNLLAPGNAAKAGDVVTIYCVGLGPLQTPVDAGGYGPADSATLYPVSVSIGGKSANVHFSRLAPGMVGVYWIEAVVPEGVDSGDQVPVTITSLTIPPAASPGVTMAVQ